MRIGNREFDFAHQVYVMGILNITPDSFSDGGLYLDPEKALDRALQIQEEGADFLDVGAESSRPGSGEIPLEEEERRLLPILRKLSPQLKIPISIDTRKGPIAVKAIEEGAALINDISALRHDPKMGHLIAERNIPCILMHMRGSPETMQNHIHYEDVVSEISRFLKERIKYAVQLGIRRDKILIDPGIGFGKKPEHNWEILRKLDSLAGLEAPILIGLSRKSFLRKFVGEEDPRAASVKSASLAAAALAVSKGASLIRAHDVLETVAFIQRSS